MYVEIVQCDDETFRWFHRMCWLMFQVLEGYGQTETTATGTLTVAIASAPGKQKNVILNI